MTSGLASATSAIYRVPRTAETEIEGPPEVGSDIRGTLLVLEELVAPTPIETDAFVFIESLAPSVRRVFISHGYPPTPAIQAEAAIATGRDAEEGPEAYRAFKKLARWLHADEDEIAGMVGTGRTTHYAWKRDNREPRPATVRRLYENYATLDAIRRRLGPADFVTWLYSGEPSRRELLLAGQLEAFDREVQEIVFQRAATSRPDLAWAPEQDIPSPESRDADAAPRPSGRRPRRARLR